MAKPFNPGIFRHKAVFLIPPCASSGTGALVDDWTPFKTAYVSVDPILGKEMYAAQTANSDVTAKIRSRYLAGINDKMRISVCGDVYEISSLVDINNAHVEFLMYCVKVV